MSSTRQKILLIPSPNLSMRQIEPYLPYGLFSLQAISHRYGGGVDILLPDEALIGKKFQNSDELADALLEEVDLCNYDTVGLSTVCNSFHHSLQIARAIKRRIPGMCVWMGGPHVSVLSERVLDAFEEVDAIFVGESELTFAEVLARRNRGDMELNGIAGLRTRKQGYIPRQPIGNLDELEWIDLADQYLDCFFSLHHLKVIEAIPLEVTRGCPGRCRFCSTSLYWGTHVRRKSDIRVISEMHRLYEHMGISRFDFLGDNFGSPRQRLLQFCETLSRESPEFQWGCALEMDNLNLVDLETLWQGGCREFFVGLESASQETLNRIQKAGRLDRKLKIVSKAVDMGFKVVTSFIIGFPWETSEDVDKTFKLHCEMLELGVSQSQFHLLCPLPGTDILSDHPVCFDREISDIAMDDIPRGNITRELVHRFPEMFLQLGHFKTPRVGRIDLVATQNAASQLNSLHSMKY